MIYCYMRVLSLERTFVNFNLVPFSTNPKKGDFVALEVGEVGLAHPLAPCVESCGGCRWQLVVDCLVSGSDEKSGD